MPTILITGAASGLGLGFLSAYSSDPSNNIIAIDKTAIPSPASEKAICFEVDVTSKAAIQSLVKKLQGRSLDLVVHSAGIRGLVPAVEASHPNDVASAESLEVMDEATMLRTFQINTLGTFTLIRALLPILRASATQARVIIMSSRMGSVSYNKTGAGYAYRASKAALNAIVKSFSIDVPSVAFVLCHPGRVATGLVKCREEGAIDVQEAVEGLLPLIERWGKEDSGRFYDRFGAPIAW
ncbi:hypothetical protein BJ546DRAFT_162134 [Cryomyces antarcticus]|uniref:NAD(P)-binding protein n=1 Tax=Cryomyces antarcticus TaxID=329879 RepID=A0ABR0M0W2_9PEZI|nr:hypothetical protein LTR16_001539 [Cryomyces antarcticus]